MTVFLGAPGSGKGTQAKRLVDSLQVKHFSTGDMLRASIASGTEVGKKAKQYIERGELVPDEVMIELIQASLRELDWKAKIVLDGFPRTVPQAEALDQNRATEVARAIYFELPHSELLKRLTGRRLCSKCNEPYHLVFNPPEKEGTCDRCGGKLFHRTDDKEEVVQRRLEIFREQNKGLLDYYRKRNKLKQIDGNRPIADIQNDLTALLS